MDFLDLWLINSFITVKLKMPNKFNFVYIWYSIYFIILIISFYVKVTQTYFNSFSRLSTGLWEKRTPSQKSPRSPLWLSSRLVVRRTEEPVLSCCAAENPSTPLRTSKFTYLPHNTTSHYRTWGSPMSSSGCHLVVMMILQNITWDSKHYLKFVSANSLEISFSIANGY